jgi:hypothetical protein
MRACGTGQAAASRGMSRESAVVGRPEGRRGMGASRKPYGTDLRPWDLLDLVFLPQ